MKIKVPNPLLLIYILTILLILLITTVPSSVIRIILGLPFVLFFPGYAMVSVLFFKKAEMDILERLALSFGMSLAIVALIGFGLNYTRWGITLDSVLYSVAGFILLVSAASLLRGALLKQTVLTKEYYVNFGLKGGSRLGTSFSIILIIAVLSAIGVLGYVAAAPKTGETFTEFYILGLTGKAEDYPSEFIMQNGQIVAVKYGTAASETAGERGKVILGIINHEQRNVTYSVKVTIEGEPVNIYYAGSDFDELGQIELSQGERWEKEIGFAPLHFGENQKTELKLFKDNNAASNSSLTLWINVKIAQGG